MARELSHKSNVDWSRPTRASRARKQSQRRDSRPLVRAAVAVSLDGYIADVQGAVEWLNPYFSPELDFGAFMASVGATVMGRNTFDAGMKLGMPPGSSDQTNIVLTRRPLDGAPPGFEPFEGDLAGLVERLARDLAGSCKDIWLMGGGATIASFLAANLVDRFELGLIPVLLGAGIPLFPPHTHGLRSLKLTHHRALKNGLVELWYERQ